MMQLVSCLLICTKDDNIEGIYDTLKECDVIHKSAGEIGVTVHKYYWELNSDQLPTNGLHKTMVAHTSNDPDTILL